MAGCQIRESFSGSRSTVSSLISGKEGEALSAAKDISFEETAEFPEDLTPVGPITEHIVGRIEGLRSVGPELFLADSYAAEIRPADSTRGGRRFHFSPISGGGFLSAARSASRSHGAAGGAGEPEEGMTLEQVKDMIDVFVLLMGGGLHRRGTDLAENASYFTLLLESAQRRQGKEHENAQAENRLLTAQGTSGRVIHPAAARDAASASPRAQVFVNAGLP